MVETIHFFSEDIQFEISDPDTIRDWISSVAASYGQSIGEINFIFCSDEYLLQINQEHLNHDTYTDIITFPLSILGQELLSDIFISIDRVKENAIDRKLSFEEELHRVLIHGILHLCGLKDKSSEEASEMRNAEDKALAILRI